MTTDRSLVAAWVDAGLLDPAAEAAIEVVRRRLGVDDDLVLLALGLVVWAQGDGHSCVDLASIERFVTDAAAVNEWSSPLPPWPRVSEFRQHLRRHPGAVRLLEHGSPGTVDEAARDRRPLVLLGDLVYTHRQFLDELSISHQVARRATSSTRSGVDTAFIDRALPIPTPGDAAGPSDPGIANQAALSVLTRELTVLTGGPGTGKTHTMSRCLAALLSHHRSELASLDIAVVAPTGKAAARAKEMISSFVADQRNPEKADLDVSDEVLETLAAVQPRTIHALLGRGSGKRTRFAHDARNPLIHDVVIVDEMSMVPTFLMARLLEAIRPGSTILLVGDQAQLESVESGSVLRGIVDGAGSRPDGTSGIYELVRVFRQGTTTKIGDLARLIRQGDSAAVAKALKEGLTGVSFVQQSPRQRLEPTVLADVIASKRTVRDLASSTDPEDHRTAYALNLRHQVLCGPRSGPTGVAAINELIGREVHGPLAGGVAQPGTPLLVTLNSPRTRLVNGDIGLVVQVRGDDGEATLRVLFPEGDDIRSLTLAELPPTEVCYAMTIHKSQGSEYEHLVVCLPASDSPLLTRELVYTAVTRARESLLIVGTDRAMTEAVDRPSVRMSGLATMIQSLIDEVEPARGPRVGR